MTTIRNASEFLLKERIQITSLHLITSHYISLHLLRLLTLVLFTPFHIFSHLLTWFAFSHGSLVISLAIQCTVTRCQELLEAGADATLLRVNPETWRCGHFDLNF